LLTLYFFALLLLTHPHLHLQEKVQIPKEYLVLGGGSFFLFMIIFGIGAGSLCSLVGFIYPTIKTIDTIEGNSSKRRSNKQWLVYWILYAFFTVIESFIDFLLYIIPFYYAFKLAFLLWAMLPQTKGAMVIYDAFLKDFVQKHESKIDAALKNAKNAAAKGSKEITYAVAEATSEVKED